MSYRNSLREKWQDPWFRRLPSDAKIVFDFVCDACDRAGFWEIDVEMAVFSTGLDAKAVNAALGLLGRSVVTDEDGRWLWARNYLKHNVRLPVADWERNNYYKAIRELLIAHKDISPDISLILDGKVPADMTGGMAATPELDTSNSGKRKKGNADKRAPFKPPAPADVEAYSKEIGWPMDGHAWCDSYAQKGWMVGKHKMKDWRSAVRNWKSNKWTPTQRIKGAGRGGKVASDTERDKKIRDGL